MAWQHVGSLEQHLQVVQGDAVSCLLFCLLSLAVCKKGGECPLLPVREPEPACAAGQVTLPCHGIVSVCCLPAMLGGSEHWPDPLHLLTARRALPPHGIFCLLSAQ